VHVTSRIRRAGGTVRSAAGGTVRSAAGGAVRTVAVVAVAVVLPGGPVLGTSGREPSGSAPLGLVTPGPGLSALIARAEAALASPSDTGASNLTDLGAGGWRVASSATAPESGAQISEPGFNARSWLPVRNDDAGAPGTEIEALLQNGDCPNDRGLKVNQSSGSSRQSVFFSANMKFCYGFLSGVGRDTDPLFDVPWWFRTDFRQRVPAGGRASLVVNGVAGSAAVWLDGHLVASPGTVTGDYTRFTFPVSDLLRHGMNTVALEILPNDPSHMYTLDDVDWNQVPPDNNSGLQFPVQLRVSGPLADGDAHVIEHNAANLSSSALTIKAGITNGSEAVQHGSFGVAIVVPGAGGKVILASTPVTVPAGRTRTVTLTPAQFPQLRVSHPHLWWPYRMGGQPLYTLVTWVSQHGRQLNSTHEQFGIRTVTSYLTGASPLEPDGGRVFTINGRRFIVRGGGFSPNIFLHYSAADIARQIVLMRNLGINTLRLEGHIMPDNFFTQMDRAGLLINAGYQCCDAWQLPIDGHGVTSADYRLLQLSALTLGQRLRNHPSVFSFQWSDNAPIPRQEKVSLAGFRRADFGDPLISSAEYNSSPILGWSGEKEGPYDWVPPDYWYDTTHYRPDDPTRTDVGGAWGYDSEQSAGDTVPTMYSIRRFMSSFEQTQLWKNPGYNQYHTNYEPGHAGYAFGTLFNFDKALAARYGRWASLAGYVEKAQLQDYEDTRAQFEAYIAESAHRPAPSTGTIYWQVNKGWPSLLWNLYNSDGDQAGSYFGAQEANRALHVLYALNTRTVTVDNLTGSRQTGLTVQERIYNLAGKLLSHAQSKPVTLASQQVASNVLRARVPATTAAGKRAQVYFAELLLKRNSTVLDRNVYWLSTHPDVVDWARTAGSPQATMTSYTNLAALSSLPRARIKVTAVTTRRPGPDGADLATTVTITNTSKKHTVALFLRADVLRGTANGHLPPGAGELETATWNRNDITLWPGESQPLTVSYDSSELAGATPVISLYGWNAPVRDIAAPVR